MTLSKSTAMTIIMVQTLALAPFVRGENTPGCSNASLTGAYGFTLSGNNISASVAYSVMGRFESSGAGTFTGDATESVNGLVVRNSFTGTYAVNSNCTGSAVLTFGGGENSGLDFTIVADGNEVLLIDTDSGTNETGKAIKQVVTHGPRGY
jgi:hypothetical protein